MLLTVALAAASGCDRRGSQDEQKPEERGTSARPAKAAIADRPVRRVVTTTPSSTEIVAAAGGASRIVGIDRFSDYPPQVVGLPVVGDFMSPSVEAILQLRPDLVVLDKVQNRTAAALAQGGVHTLVLEMHTVEDVLQGLSSAGRALGTQREAGAARAALEREIAEARARGRARPRRVRTLMIVDRELGALRGLVAAGPGSYLDQLLTMVGGENVLSGASTRYPNIAPETVIEARPDVILDAVHADDPAGAAREWKALTRVPAVASGRVHPLVETYYKSPGPRLALALRGLEALLWRDSRE
jgi:iron complex transport system substrate-binding protein